MQIAEYIADRPSLLNVANEIAKHKSGQRVLLNDNNDDNENDINKKYDSTCRTLNQAVSAN